MRVTRDWLDATDHCPDGLAYALGVLPPDGLELEDCWPLLHRADWIVSLAVQTHYLSFAEARGILAGILKASAEAAADVVTLGWFKRYDPRVVYAIRPAHGPLAAELASDAYLANAAQRNEPRAHRLNALAQLMASDFEADRRRSLKSLQGAAFSLGLAMGQDRAAQLVKERAAALLEGHVRA